MDLYSFIGNNVPKPSPKDQQGSEAWPIQTGQRQGSDSDNEAAAQPHRLMEAEAFAALKEELFNRINTLENHVAALKREQIDLYALSRTKDNSLGEAAALITEKSSELERLKSDISALKQTSEETLYRIQNAEKGNQACIEEAERVKKDCSVFMKETKKALIIACIAALIAIAGLFVYFSKQNASQQNQARQPVSADTTKSEDKAAIAAWPRSPIALTVGNFRVSLAHLKPEAANKLASELKDAATATHNFYNIEIRAKRGAISARFLKSPSIDFININGIRAKSLGSESDLRVIQTSLSGKQRSRRRTALFRCIVSLKKEFQPVGLLIGDLNKRTRSIAIYA